MCVLNRKRWACATVKPNRDQNACRNLSRQSCDNERPIAGAWLARVRRARGAVTEPGRLAAVEQSDNDRLTDQHNPVNRKRPMDRPIERTGCLSCIRTVPKSSQMCCRWLA
jgi:hypothetical protein